MGDLDCLEYFKYLINFGIFYPRSKADPRIMVSIKQFLIILVLNRSPRCTRPLIRAPPCLPPFRPLCPRTSLGAVPGPDELPSVGGNLKLNLKK